ncbi:MAG: hypothetical protein Q8O12_00775 [Candidatus Omnitrophota bacterium]|nr:hypothetical protein [Candidatus Omnitrophota bacterium]
MWWKWVIFVICAVLILSCVISTTIDWCKGKTGPFGPKPADWWGCGIFTILIGLLMLWLGRQIFKT